MIPTHTPDAATDADTYAAFLLEREQIAVECMGWLPLDDSVYLHVGNTESDVVEIVGLVNVGIVGSNVLWMV